MPDNAMSMAIGFLGEQDVHRDNAVALLDDLIDGHRRNNKNARIRFIVPVEPFTESMEDLADYCLNSGYVLDLVGHHDAFENVRVQQYMGHAEYVTEVADKTSVANTIVNRLAPQLHNRLILLAEVTDKGDIENDLIYDAVVLAKSKNILVRSLVGGMEKVLLPSEEEESENMPRASRREIEDEEGLEDDEDGADAEADDDEDEDEEPAPRRRRRAAAAAPVEDDDEDDDDDDGDGEDDEDEEPAPASRKRAAPRAAARETVHYTEARLNRIATTNKDEFYGIAEGFNVFSGKGRKISTMIREVLEAQDGVKPPAKRAAAATAAPAKRAARRTEPEPSAKAPAAKKAAAPKAVAAKTPKTQALRGLFEAVADELERLLEDA